MKGKKDASKDVLFYRSYRELCINEKVRLVANNHCTKIFTIFIEFSCIDNFLFDKSKYEKHLRINASVWRRTVIKNKCLIFGDILNV